MDLTVLTVFLLVYLAMILGRVPGLALDRTGAALVGAIALVALACASNVGSAATLIGNPQNMLIGQVLDLSFSGYLAWSLVPTAAGLLLVWLIIAGLARKGWEAPVRLLEAEVHPFSPWQTGKGLAVLGALVLLFLLAPWPREITALAGAGLLMCSRRMRSREILGLVDWQLLVLFVSLFVLNRAMLDSGVMETIGMSLLGVGVDLRNPAWLFGTSAALSNLVSNVPAVMLLLPSAVHPAAGPVLALSSTLAGNLFIVGSIANIIVVDQAGRSGVRIGWREHARYGVPVTLATLAAAAAWLLLLSFYRPM